MADRFPLLFVGLFVLCAGCGASASYETFSDWDADDDETISPDEFTAAFSDHGGARFSSWDGDANGRLTEKEFLNGLYRIWDFDDDGAIDKNEWNTWSGYWY